MRNERLFIKTAFISVLTVVFGTVFVFDIHTYDVFVPVKDALLLTGVLGYLIFGLVALLFGQKRWDSLSFVWLKRLWIAAAAVALVMVLSMLGTSVPHDMAFLYAAYIIVGLWAFVLTGLLFYAEHKLIKKMYIFLLLLIVLQAIYSSFQAMGIDFRFWAGWEGRGRIFTTIGNPNFASIFNGMLFVALVYLGIQRKIFFLLLSVLPLALVSLAGSRGVFLSSIAVALYLLVRYRRYSVLLLLTVLLFMSFAVFPSFQQRLKTSLYLRQGTSADRLMLYKIALDKVLEHPLLGYGFGSYKFRYLEDQGEYFEYIPYTQKKKSTDAKHTHDEYIQLVYEAGVIGFGLVLTFLISLLRITPGAIQYPFLVLFGQALFSFPLHISAYIGLLFVLVMVSAAALPLRRWQKAGTFSRAHSLVLGSGLIFVLLALFCAQAFTARYQANRLIRQGLKQNSIQILTRAMHTVDWDGMPSAMLGLVYLNKGESRKAIPILRRSIAHLKDADNYNNLGIAYERVGRMLAAEHFYRKSIYVLPRAKHVYMNLAYLYSKTGQKSKLMHLTEVMARIFPESGDIFLPLGNYYVGIKDYRLAKRTYLRGLRFEPKNIKLLYNLGAVHYYMGDNNTALKYFLRVKRLDPNYPNIDRTIGVVRRQR